MRPYGGGAGSRGASGKGEGPRVRHHHVHQPGHRVSVAATFRTLNKDVRVSDNGDGIPTILALTTQVVQFDGPDGERLFLDAGAARAVLLVDNGDTAIDPADDEVIDFSLVRSVGRGDTFDRDFCTDMKALLN